MRPIFVVLLLSLLATPAAVAQEAVEAILVKTPWCGCCTAYGAYLEDHGFRVTVEEHEDLSAIKRAHGVPQGLEGCHTLLLDGYVVEGHVPIASLLRLLRERPKVDGLSLPGMPAGSPGMSGERQGPFEIRSFAGGESLLYTVE